MYQGMTTYDKDFIARVKDYAAIGLYPPQIAERLGLVGKERSFFLLHIQDPDHPLAKEYWKSKGQQEEDIDAALQTACVAGDPKALKIAYELRQQTRIDELTKELFGV